MIQKVLIRVGISLMLTACGAQNSNVGQEALIGVENPPGVENPVVIAPDKTETPNDNVQMTSPAANSRISVAGAFRLSASIEHPAGINDVEFILGEFDRFYLKLGLNGVPSLQINEMVDLKKLNFDEPGLRTIDLQNDFAPEDITGQAKPLAAAK